MLPLVGPGAAECDESNFSSCLLQRCRMVDPPPHHHHPHRQSTQAALLKGTKKPKANSVLSLPLSFSGTDFFFFHSLTSCSLGPPLSLAGCRVSLYSCHTGPPTLTHGGGREGGREGGTQRPLVAKDRLRFSSQSNSQVGGNVRICRR